MEVKQYTAGYSNLTYLLRFPNQDLIMRRPPFGKIPPKSHDMKREYRVLQLLEHPFPYAPAPYTYEEDKTIMNRHFYVMEKKEGAVLDDQIPEEISAFSDYGTRASHAMIDALISLHAIDIDKHSLTELGRPKGYMERQVLGWIKRYHQSVETPHQKIETLTSWFTEQIPEHPESTVVHNDMKLNNMMLDPNNPEKVTAVFDWELCTVGDPLSDLASSIAYWKEPGEGYTGLSSVTDNGAFLSRLELIHRYAYQTGRDVSNMTYYLSFAFFKISVILQQIYLRWKQGEIEDERFASLDSGIQNLINLSFRTKNNEII
nr:phosphotransferase family protein [Geomicrobium halophilum]